MGTLEASPEPRVVPEALVQEVVSWLFATSVSFALGLAPRRALRAGDAPGPAALELGRADRRDAPAPAVELRRCRAPAGPGRRLGGGARSAVARRGHRSRG